MVPSEKSERNDRVSLSMFHSSICGRKDADTLFSSGKCVCVCTHVYTYMYVHAYDYMELMADLILNTFLISNET